MPQLRKLTVNIFHLAWVIRIDEDPVLLPGILFVICHRSIFYSIITETVPAGTDRHCGNISRHLLTRFRDWLNQALYSLAKGGYCAP